MRNARLLQVPALLVAVGAILCSLPAKAASPDDDLRSKYRGKVLMLRNFYCGQDLRFNEQGDLQTGGETGAWTICRDVRIDDLKIKNGSLHITGQRIYLAHNAGQDFLDVLDLEPNDAKKAKKYKDLIQSQKISIEAQLPQNADSSGVQAVMDKLFYASQQEFFEAVPDLWKCFFPTGARKTPCGGSAPEAKPTQLSQEEPLSNAERIVKGVRAPWPTYEPDPSFTNEARMAKYQGTTLMSIVVDPTGNVKLIHVIRPLGMGLDEQAAATIATWKFAPAERGDQPVAVQVNVEVTFNLY